ncbi:MAG: DUF6796 family protein [Desulfobacterales bacterium]
MQKKITGLASFGDRCKEAPATHTALTATFAALAATLGDLLMLYVINSRRPELLLPELPEVFLWVGGALGVVGIPFYSAGYHAAARILGTISQNAARAVFFIGILVAVLGAVIHGITALKIHADLKAGAAVQDPLLSVLSWGPAIIVLWALAAVLVFTASAVFFWFAIHGRGFAPFLAGLANPALVTVLLSVVGMSTPLLRSFLIPSAPNMAHVTFFAVCVWANRSGRIKTGMKKSRDRFKD